MDAISCYRIEGPYPPADQRMGCWGFSVDLSRRFAKAAAAYDQPVSWDAMNESGYRFIETVCPWTSGHISTPPYMPIDGLLVGHINVPGNACGLDIYPSWSPDAIGPVQYLPHNVDGTQQAYLILCLWTYWYNAAAATLRAQQELRDKAHAPPDRYMYRHYTYGFPDDD